MSSVGIESTIWRSAAAAWRDPVIATRNGRLARGRLSATELEGWLEGISLSKDQLDIVFQDEERLMINGSAGSGKSITLMHKMFNAMEWEQDKKRILYVTFNLTLVYDTWKRLKESDKFQEAYKRHDIKVHTFHFMVQELLGMIGITVPDYSTNQSYIRKQQGTLKARTLTFWLLYTQREEYKKLPRSQHLYQTHDSVFFMEEMLWLKAHGIIRKRYLDPKTERTGRGLHPRVTFEQRKTIYSMYEEYEKYRREKYGSDDLDAEDYALLLLQNLEKLQHLKYDYIFVDEMQDLQPMQMLALVLLCRGKLVLAGDQKQRIYKRSPLTLKDVGLDQETLRNRYLKTNHRSTLQIMKLASSIDFIDTENDRVDPSTVLAEGSMPQIRYFESNSELGKFVVNEIREIYKKDRKGSVAVIHRYDNQVLGEISSNIKLRLAQSFDLITTDQYGRRFDRVSEKKPIFFTDAYSVKGLEFDTVFVIHFDRERYPHSSKYEKLNGRDDKGTDSFLQDEDEILNEEKKILYVALTRAKQRVYLLYYGRRPTMISPFVREFYATDYEAHGFDSEKYSK